MTAMADLDGLRVGSPVASAATKVSAAATE
jgi:hypothetical protein